MRVLVTGGTGFIGSHLVEKLVTDNHKVVCLAKDEMFACSLQNENVTTIIADLNNGNDWENILDNIDIVYHLAGITRARKNRDYFTGNTECTRNFVQACARHGRKIRRFVYVSSLTAVGPSPNGEPVNESTAPHPVSEYGRSKILAEQAVLSCRDHLPVSIVRPSAVYGPRDQDMYKYFRLIVHGLHPVIGFRKKRLNLIHVDDLVAGIRLAGEHPRAEDEIFFLGSKDSYSNEEIGEAIASAVHTRPLRVRIPHALVYFVGAVAEVLGKFSNHPVFFNIQKARESVQHAWDCSIEKASLLLNFRPAMPLEQGMQSTYEWYLEHTWL